MDVIFTTALFTAALFLMAFGVAIATIAWTVIPYASRIHSLLTRGVQYRSMALPAPRSRAAGKAMPRLTAMPARLRAVA